MGHRRHRSGRHHGGRRGCVRVREQRLRRERDRTPGGSSHPRRPEATGGGTANAVERDSENGGFWEVEVKKPDGAIVDVRLNADYSVLMVEGDSETADTNDASS
jgi:hypothetical protein